ncbi:anti-repressor SinI family protein [Virgibacillus ndiopensis]|nr:anti-repressor SinI family protein [Virgibacillus ndiopensis]
MDWVNLILAAKNIGLTPAQVRAFLKQKESIDTIQQQ